MKKLFGFYINNWQGGEKLSVVYRHSLTSLWQDSAIVLPGFILGCHNLGMFCDKFWAKFGHVLANIGDTKIWLEHEKSMVKTKH